MTMESALDGIVRSYISQELYHEESQNGGAEKPTTDNQNYVQILHDCLERKGVTRELQAFLRHRLVQILQDKLPEAITAQCKLTENVQPAIVKLLIDFLCTKKLLFTLSVISSELGIQPIAKENFRKLLSRDAETLLEDLKISKDSDLSMEILKNYSECKELSLLECIFKAPANLSKTSQSLTKTLQELTREGSEIFKQNSTTTTNSSKTCENCRQKQKVVLTKNHKSQTEDLRPTATESKLRAELQQKMELERISRENELFQNYQDKMKKLRRNFEWEKELWLAEKEAQEKALEDRQLELQNLLDTITLKQKEILNNQKGDRPPAINVASTNSEHDNLLREARLLSRIKKLEDENSKLTGLISGNMEKEDLSPIKKPQRISSQKQLLSIRALSDDNNDDSIAENSFKIRSQNRNLSQISNTIDQDKLAFLQYNLEKQAEEIQKLRQKLDSSTVLAPPNSKTKNEKDAKSGAGGVTFETAAKHKANRESELISFLTRSRRRCEEIDQEAKLVDLKLREIKAGRHKNLNFQKGGKSQFTPHFDVYSQSKYTPLSELFQKILREESQCSPWAVHSFCANESFVADSRINNSNTLHTSTPIRGQQRSLYNNNYEKEKILENISSNFQNQSNSFYEQEEELERSQQVIDPEHGAIRKLAKNDNKQASSSKRILENVDNDQDFENFQKDNGKVDKNTSSSSKSNSSSSHSEKAERTFSAVKKGALAFEKVHTTAEERKYENSSESIEIEEKITKSTAYKTGGVSKIPAQSNKSKKKKSVQIFDEVNDLHQQSLSLSFPQNTDNDDTNNDESDFWKL